MFTQNAEKKRCVRSMGAFDWGFRMTRSIRLSWIRMSHPSSSISSEKITDEFGWAWHTPNARERTWRFYDSLIRISIERYKAAHLMSSHLMGVVDGWLFLIRMSPIQRALYLGSCKTFTSSRRRRGRVSSSSELIRNFFGWDGWARMTHPNLAEPNRTRHPKTEESS